MLPIHPQPLPGEILSSWMVRLAFSNGFPLHTFYSHLLEFREALWNRDIDRHPSEQLLKLLGLHTQQPLSTLREMTLCGYEGVLFTELSMHGDVKWLLPLGLFHRNRTRAGMQYCPLCMRADPTPYYRLSWRTALTVLCPIHNCVMGDVCPKCASPIMFHRHGIGARKSPYVENLRRCHQCGFHLGDTAARFPDWPDCHSLEFLIALIRHWELSPWRYLQILTPCAIPFFVGLRVLLVLLNGRYCQRFESVFCDELGCESLAQSPLPFEYLDVGRRLQLLLRACWLLQDWPSRFVESCRRAHLSRSRITEFPDRLPFWLERGISQLDQRIYSPNHDELTAAATYLCGRREQLSWQTMRDLFDVHKDCAKRLCSNWKNRANH